jgi:hypothetical protein
MHYYFLHKIKRRLSSIFATILLGMLLLLSNACKKTEGKGGQATIKGKLSSKSVYNVNSSSRAEVNEDVYIIYGNGSSENDKIKTSGDGSFEFRFLQPGNYKLYAFGLDTSNPKASITIAYYKEIKVNSKKEVVEVSDFIIYKKINGGTNTISGKLISKNAFNAGTTNNDYLPLPNEDIFIVYGSGSQYDDKTKTAADGSFQFIGLRDGNYRIYAYSVDTSGSFPVGTVPIFKNISLTGNNNTLNTGNLLVYKINGGTNRISGKLISRNAYNAGTNFKDSIPEPNEDVFIVYGNGTQYYDKVKTSADGSFQFTGLRSGDYRIYAYSLDVSGPHPSGAIPIYKNVNLAGVNIDKNIGDLVVYKDADQNGTSIISGRIYAFHYSKAWVLQYQGSEADCDVYIRFGNKPTSYNQKIITDASGNFQFRNLRQGNYIVYALSDTNVVNNSNNGVVKRLKSVVITSTGSTSNIGDINIWRN